MCVPVTFAGSIKTSSFIMKTKLHLALLFFVALLLFTSTAFAQAALNFDGANDYLSKEAVISTNTTNFTIEAWVKWNGSGGNQAILYNGSTGGSGYGIYLLGGGQIAALMGGVAFVESGVSLTAGEWTHLAIARNSTTLTLYKNGVSIATSAAAPYNPNGNFTIGSNHAGGELFNGNIDEVRFWTVERSQAQIKSNMNATLSVQANLLAYYTFSNGIPNANNAGITTIPDVSGNNNTLTLNNFALTGTASNFVQNFVEIYYVDAAATGDGRGLSWANAAPQLADALKWARLQNNFTTANPLKIYVAKGTYKPMYNAADGQFTTDGGRDNAFVMVNNVQLYGGFDPANGIDDLTDTRILPASGEGLGTILSGDIGTIGTKTDNAFHVVVSVRGVGNATLDGFTVSGGYSTAVDNQAITINNEAITRYIGAGMYNVVSSPAIANCNFSENTASIGGGIYNYSSSASITNCNFTANTSANYGGAMCNNGSSVTITNCSFIGNTASSNGGGMFNLSSSPSIINCSFTGNSASTYGSGMYFTASSPIITNTTIANNGNNGFYNSSSTLILRNSIVWDAVTLASNGSYNATYSLIKGANPSGTGNINATLYTETDIFTNYSAKDYTLKTTSPAVNNGDNSLYVGLNANTLDVAGNKRLISATVDMGAYENQTLVISPDANNIVYVNIAADGTGNGFSWASAITQLADALKYARTTNNYTPGNPLKIFVAKGTYKPLYNAADGSYTTDGGSDNAFVMVNNVQIYGGFDPDNGIDDLTDSRLLPFQAGGLGSILSGDIGAVGVNTDNVYHVVVSSGAVGGTILDGFTITGAYSTLSNTESITINGNTLRRYYGGGMYNYSSSPTVNNCSFTANSAYNGGGMYNVTPTYSSPVVTNCSFTQNSATNGGAMYNYAGSNTVAVNCVFVANSASANGSGIYNFLASLMLINVTLGGNTGNNGLYSNTSTPILYNTIIWDVVSGSYTANYSLVKGASSTANGNINAGSLLETDIFTDYANGDYTLKSYSPAINKGSNTLFTDLNVAPLDLAGNTRVYKYANLGVIDMGAYEYQNVDVTPNANNILFVNINAVGQGSGTDWANAIPQLADALKWARQQNNFTSGNPLKIFVAKGTYKPLYNAADGQFTTDGGRDNAFVMVNNVQIYGGFDPDNGITNLTHARILPSSGGGTFLSGDIGTISDKNDNTYHVVLSSGAVGAALIDGFTITEGSSTYSVTGTITLNGNTLSRTYGGGILNWSSSPAITNCNFIANEAYLFGAGMCNVSSSPVISNCIFSANSTSNNGGGIANSSSSPILNNVNIWANNAGVGGGIYNSNASVLALFNVNISSNSASSGGGVYNDSSSGSQSAIYVTNGLFSKNLAFFGGAIYNSSFSSATLTNATFGDNGSQGLSTSVNATLVLQNCIVWDNINDGGGTYTSAYSLIKGSSSTANGNINASSLVATNIFANYAGGDYKPKSYSPAINKGSNALFAGLNAATLDLAGNKRVYNYAYNDNIDMGAYEYQSVDIIVGASNIVYVNASVLDGTGDGSSWANAANQLADALKWTRQQNNFTSDNPLKIFVAKGTYKPLYNAADGQFTTDGGRDNAFVMVNNVQLYGGFDPANGIDDLTDTRISGSGGSVLSGDIGTTSLSTDNAYHVVVSSGAVGAAKLDGFTIMWGRSESINTNAIIVNSYSLNNGNGGGMTIHTSSPIVSNCNFVANSARGGGAIYNVSASSSVSVVVSNCRFTQNVAWYNGGALNNHGVYITVVNSVFTDNLASGNGSGIYGSAGSLSLTNVTLAANGGYNGLFTDYSTPTIYNSIIWDVVSGNYWAYYSLIKGASASINGNINATLYTETDIFTNYGAGDFTLKTGSPAIAKGSNQLYWDVVNGGIAPPSLEGVGGGDLAGNPRVYNYATGGTIDLGAYEYQGLTSQTIIFAALLGKSIGDADFNLTATASSSLVLSYTSGNTSVATVSGNTVSIKGSGSTIITASQPGNADYTAATSIQQTLQVSGVLPVDLIDFTAKIEGNYAKLQWQTANERNNRGFEIYRSGDNKEFVKIGEVPASTDRQSSVSSYIYYNKQPMKGNNYYKLLQVDYDGTLTELGERILNFSLSALSLQVYPNPTTDLFTVTFEEGIYHKIELIDMLGKVLQSCQISNKLSSYQLALGKYPAGTYLLKLSSANKEQFVKVIKQ